MERSVILPVFVTILAMTMQETSGVSTQSYIEQLS
jgi:hypothetical protein